MSKSNDIWCMNMGGWAGVGCGVAETLRARDYKDPSIVFIPKAFSVDTRNGSINEEVNGTLQAKNTGGFSVNCNIVVMTEEDSEDKKQNGTLVIQQNGCGNMVMSNYGTITINKRR